jgi:hypothetical protein
MISQWRRLADRHSAFACGVEHCHAHGMPIRAHRGPTNANIGQQA